MTDFSQWFGMLGRCACALLTLSACESRQGTTPDAGGLADVGTAVDGGAVADVGAGAGASSVGTVRTCSEYLPAFAPYADLVTADCEGDALTIDSATGLPDPTPADVRDKAMVGITSWIQRVPIPYSFSWRLPANPEWLATGYQNTTGIGPIAVAINGVPIFHYEARPEEEIDPNRYDERSDTVQQGELDQCGGHAGQGEDYHYHYAPVCLLGVHDLTQPIAFGLDGVPVYFGTGGDAFYGGGRYDDLNQLPGGSGDSLDLCNAHDLGDGTYVYYTTKEAPYVLGCHRARFDRATQINVPFGGRPQGSPVPFGTEAGEPIQTAVLDWFQDGADYHFRFDRGGGVVGEIIYRQSDAARDCWTFEFKNDVGDDLGDVEEYCR